MPFYRSKIGPSYLFLSFSVFFLLQGERDFSKKMAEQNKKKRRILKKGFGGTEEKKTLKLQENGVLLPSKKQKSETKTKQETKRKEGFKTPFCMLKHNPLFLIILQLLSIIDSKNLLKTQNVHFRLSPVPAETPFSVAFYDLY